ncbi:MAG: TIGR03936 family radical SAM-associated protein [Clostridiales bacterium]|nr:TIGR03936 family radical SAM-associated protein [Clostridiales bacterium]
MRLCVVFSKGPEVRFVSHLDVQRLFQRAFRRAKLPLAYSQGFNPHPLISFATALSVGYTSRGEYLDITLTEPMTPEEFKDAAQKALPEGINIVEVFDLGDSRKSLTSAMRSAEYTVKAVFDSPVTYNELKAALDELLGSEIVVDKKTKGGIKPTDIRPMVISADIAETDGCTAYFNVSGVLSAEGGLNPEMFMNELLKKLSADAALETERTKTVLDRELLK